MTRTTNSRSTEQNLEHSGQVRLLAVHTVNTVPETGGDCCSCERSIYFTIYSLPSSPAPAALRSPAPAALQLPEASNIEARPPPEVVGQRDAGNGEEDDDDPISAMGQEAAARYMKAKLRVLQEELEGALKENQKKETRNTELSKQVKQLGEKLSKLQNIEKSVQVQAHRMLSASSGRAETVEL